MGNRTAQRAQMSFVDVDVTANIRPILRTCSEDGCGQPHIARGFCTKHYQQYRKSGECTPTRRRKACSMLDCEKLAQARGLCPMHYQRWRTGADPRGVYQSTALIRDSLGRKQCSRCDEWLYPELFSPHAEKADKLSSQCKRCKADSNHRLSLERRNQLLEARGGKCICGAPLVLYGRSRQDTYAIDHDHECCAGGYSCGKCIRGLLCSGCNAAAGHLRNSPTAAFALGRYLAGEE